MVLHSQEITLPGTDAQVEVFFYHTPGCPAKMYMSDGSPGYPEEYEEVEITRVVPVERGSCYCDIMPALSESTLDAIETMLLEMDYNEEF